jgi:Na+/proline symporter
LIQITITTAGALGGPVLGVFLLGALVKRANSPGTLLGAFVGTLMGIVIGFSETILQTHISFLWVGFIAAVTTFCTGWAASFISPPPTLEQQTLVHRWANMREKYCE